MGMPPAAQSCSEAPGAVYCSTVRPVPGIRFNQLSMDGPGWMDRKIGRYMSVCLYVCMYAYKDSVCMHGWMYALSPALRRHRISVSPRGSSSTRHCTAGNPWSYACSQAFCHVYIICTYNILYAHRIQLCITSYAHTARERERERERAMAG